MFMSASGTAVHSFTNVKISTIHFDFGRVCVSLRLGALTPPKQLGVQKYNFGRLISTPG